MTHEQIYIKQKILPELTKTEAEGSLYQLIEQSLVIGYADQEFSQLLAAKVGSPAFLAHTTAYSVNGYPILYDDSHYRADKYTFHNILYRKH